MMLWLSSGKYNYNLYSEDGSATESDFVSGMSMGRSSLRLVYMSNLDSQLQEKSIRYYALEVNIFSLVLPALSFLASLPPFPPFLSSH
jgi:hypothetical protein